MARAKHLKQLCFHELL